MSCENATGAGSGVKSRRTEAYEVQEEKMLQEFFINDDGIKLHAKLEKPDHVEKCPLLVIIHGLTGHMEERHIAAVADTALELDMAALRVEMYGHGKSEGRFEDHTLLKWISNALKALDYAKSLDFVTDIYLTGHSQGGLLSILVAGMRHDDIKALIPLSPALCITDGARTGNILGMTFDPEHIPDEFFLSGGERLRGDYLRAAQLIDVPEMMKKFRGPVLFVHGDADEAVPAEYSVKAKDEYENARLVLIPEDTHCFDHHLDQMLAAVKTFLAEN